MLPTLQETPVLLCHATRCIPMSQSGIAHFEIALCDKQVDDARPPSHHEAIVDTGQEVSLVGHQAFPLLTFPPLRQFVFCLVSPSIREANEQEDEALDFASHRMRQNTTIKITFCLQ